MNSQNYTVQPGYYFAGFWIRVAAYVVDSLVMLPTAMFYVVFEESTAWILQTAIIILYSALLESSEWQATLGKKVFDIKVTDSNQNRITFLRAVARAVLILVSFGFPLLFLIVAISERKRGLHDMICGTLVSRREVSGKDIELEVSYQSKE